MTPPLLAPGSMLGPRWIMGGLLGQSDGAEVYEAEEAHQRRFAAIKFFDPAYAAEPAWGEHARVTRALSELPGEGIARAYDIGMEATYKRPYVASERLTFPTLSRYIAERGQLSLRALAQALGTLAGGLDAAHAVGIVHGGLKPHNVFISFENPEWARITDFAVARLRGANGRGPLALLGWSAPEAQAGYLTAAGDRYALGLLCYFAATGLPWYNALRTRDDPTSERQRGTRVASERAKSQGAELDPMFDDWFKQALAADPAARFATARDMAQAFIDVFGGGPTGEFPLQTDVHPMAATMPSAGSERRAVPDSAPETPMAATVAISPPAASARAPSFPPASSQPFPSRPPAPARELGPWLWLVGAGLFGLLVLTVWWVRTR